MAVRTLFRHSNLLVSSLILSHRVLAFWYKSLFLSMFVVRCMVAIRVWDCIVFSLFSYQTGQKYAAPERVLNSWYVWVTFSRDWCIIKGPQADLIKNLIYTMHS